MRWLIDSDVLIEGERGHPGFIPWLEAQQEIATADVVRCEFLLGVHAVTDPGKRSRGEQFYTRHIAGLASIANEPADFPLAAKLAGEARRNGKGKPSVVDALLAAIALRTGAMVGARNLTDFVGMGCPCANPLS